MIPCLQKLFQFPGIIRISRIEIVDQEILRQIVSLLFLLFFPFSARPDILHYTGECFRKFCRIHWFKYIVNHAVAQCFSGIREVVISTEDHNFHIII